MSDIGSEEFEEDEGINLGVSEKFYNRICRRYESKLVHVNIISNLPAAIEAFKSVIFSTLVF